MKKNIKKILFFILALSLSFSLLACNKNSSKEEKKIADNTEYYDTITKTLKLNKTYQGKNFLTEGIGNATVSAFTDGDTTRFLLPSGDTIVIRYYQVDTPESTSNIDKWGKAASNFTKNALSKATEIVLEATAERAEHDSYGVRYLGYVWYKTADYDSFKCLNLELVENGFSENKGMNTSDYPYYSYFDKANKFAQEIKLRLYSKLDDPLYSTDPVEMSLKDFYDNQDLYYNSDTDSGAKVKLVACLTSLYKSSSGTYTYTATEVDFETGEKYTINVYAGYDSGTASSMKLGHLYEIIGNVNLYYGNFQISGIVYDTIYTLEGYTKVIQKDYYLNFDSNVEKYMAQNGTTLYSDITVTSVTLNDNEISFVGTAKQRNKTGYSDTVYTFTFKVAKPTNYSGQIKEGSKISVGAYQQVAGSNELTILNYSNLTIR